MVRLNQWEALKKLTEAAQYLFHGGPSNLEEQAQALGLELPDGYLAAGDVEIEPECWDAVVMFQRVLTQWRTGPHGPVGLDYGAVQFMLSLWPSDEPRQLVDDLQVMEVVWLNEWRKEVK